MGCRANFKRAAVALFRRVSRMPHKIHLTLFMLFALFSGFSLLQMASCPVRESFFQGTVTQGDNDEYHAAAFALIKNNETMLRSVASTRLGVSCYSTSDTL